MLLELTFSEELNDFEGWFLHIEQFDVHLLEEGECFSIGVPGFVVIVQEAIAADSQVALLDEEVALDWSVSRSRQLIKPQSRVKIDLKAPREDLYQKED